jgi:hypothetical protein
LQNVRGPSILAGLIGAVAALCFHVSAAHASDDLIEGAKLCTRQLPHYEREYGIPTHLLSAIASTESGRYHQGLGLRIPWPWTINVEGKGYFFKSKEEAIAAVRKYQARGVQSIDVGCMQVNLVHHAHAFSSLDQAFEPQFNVAYAASFLRSLYEEERSWKKAAADYHSKTPVLGSQYAGLVYDSWYQILEKLRLAKQEVPGSATLASNEQPAPYVRQMDAPIQDRPAAVQPKTITYHAPHMNIVQISKKDNSRENGVIVVRPDTSTPETSAALALNTAQTSSAHAPVAAAHTQNAPMAIPDEKIIHINATAPVNNDNRQTGPTFIFND